MGCNGGIGRSVWWWSGGSLVVPRKKWLRNMAKETLVDMDTKTANSTKMKALGSNLLSFNSVYIENRSIVEILDF